MPRAATEITMHPFESLASQIGQGMGVSDWLLIDQARIDAFAAATEDFQWIHVDADRAAAGPFGATVAHGYLTLSLLPRLTGDTWRRSITIQHALNYGLDKVRFLTPVRAGSRIRNRLRLISAEARGEGRTLIGFENSVEIEGEAKPALVATTLVMVIH
jgi:acyl dehydratase